MKAKTVNLKETKFTRKQINTTIMQRDAKMKILRLKQMLTQSNKYI